jgi:hypothetical protein
LKIRQNRRVIPGRFAALGMNRRIRPSIRSYDMEPMQFPFNPPSRFIRRYHRYWASWLFHRRRGRFNPRRSFSPRFNQGPFRNPVIEQVFKNRCRAFYRYKMLGL